MVTRLLRLRSFCIALLLLLVCTTAPVAAQITTFTYQGKLADNGNPANGSYDFQFSLWDPLSGGASVAPLNTLAGVTVTNGNFIVTLDFGATAFPGANRYLEIAVRPANTGPSTPLTPRQQILSTPYAIKATAADGLSVACVNCITSSQIQSVQGSQVTGNISGNQISGTIPVASVPAGSTNYIQNGTGQQASSNFNISGNGIIGGNLGIGTPTPAHTLQVNGTTLLGAPGGVYGFSIDNGASPGPYPSLAFNAYYNAPTSSYLAGGTGYGGIFQFHDGDGFFGFYSTNTSVAAGTPHTFTPRFVIGNNGNVGIGTTSPGYRLDVIGGVRSLDSVSTHFVAETTGETNAWAKFIMKTLNRSWAIGTSQNFNGDQLYIADETAGQIRL